MYSFSMIVIRSTLFLTILFASVPEDDDYHSFNYSSSSDDFSPSYSPNLEQSLESLAGDESDSLLWMDDRNALFQSYFNLIPYIGEFRLSDNHGKFLDAVLDHLRNTSVSTMYSLERVFKRFAYENGLGIDCRFSRKMLWYFGIYAESKFKQQLGPEAQQLLTDAYVLLSSSDKSEYAKSKIYQALPWTGWFLEEASFYLREYEVMKELDIRIQNDWEIFCNENTQYAFPIVKAFSYFNLGSRAFYISYRCAESILKVVDSFQLSYPQVLFLRSLVEDLNRIDIENTGKFGGLDSHQLLLMEWFSIEVATWNLLWEGEYELLPLFSRYHSHSSALVKQSELVATYSKSGMSPKELGELTDRIIAEENNVKRSSHYRMRFLWSLHVNSFENNLTSLEKVELVSIFKNMEILLCLSSISKLRDARMLVWKTSSLLESVSKKDMFFVSELQEAFTEGFFRNLVIAEWRSKSGKIRDANNRIPVDWFQYFESFTDAGEKNVIRQLLRICQKYAIGLFVHLPFRISSIPRRERSIVSLIRHIFPANTTNAFDEAIEEGSFKYASTICPDETCKHVLESICDRIKNDPDHMLSHSSVTDLIPEEYRNTSFGISTLRTLKIFYHAPTEASVQSILSLSISSDLQKLSSLLISIEENVPNPFVNVYDIINIFLKQYSWLLPKEEVVRLLKLNELVLSANLTSPGICGSIWSFIDAGEFRVALRVVSSSNRVEWRILRRIIQMAVESREIHISKTAVPNFIVDAVLLGHKSTLYAEVKFMRQIRSLRWMIRVYSSLCVSQGNLVQVGRMIREGKSVEDFAGTLDKEFESDLEDYVVERRFLSLIGKRFPHLIGPSGGFKVGRKELVPINWKTFFSNFNQGLTVLTRNPSGNGLFGYRISTLRSEFLNAIKIICKQFENGETRHSDNEHYFLRAVGVLEGTQY